MNLFKDAAAYYKYRPEYPEDIIKLIVSKAHVDGTTNLLDIGCGTGSLCIPLSKYFKEIFAVDIDAGMIEEGKKSATLHDVDNIEWINQDASNFEDKFNNIQVVTFGCSLHWFDAEKTLNFVYKLLPDNGSVFVTGFYTIWGYAPQPWQQKVLEIIKKYLGPNRMTLHGKYQSSGKSDLFVGFLKSAGFEKSEVIKFDLSERILNVDEIVGYQYSTSYAAPALFKDKLSDFEKELKTELLKIHPDNKFVEKNTGFVTIGWKK